MSTNSATNSVPRRSRPATRRRILGALLAAPAVVATGRAVTAGLRAVPFLRPAADGTSARRCAQCGQTGHTMLDPTCPVAPEVWT